MLGKFKASGPGMAKYVIIFWIVNIGVGLLWFFDALIPFGKEFVILFQNSLNNGVWDLIPLLTPVFWIFVYFVVCEIITFLITLLLYKLAVNHINNY